MYTDVLQYCLTNDQRQAGLSLVEEGDDYLLLKRGDQVLAVFSQKGATVASVRAEADHYLSGETAR